MDKQILREKQDVTQGIFKLLYNAEVSLGAHSNFATSIACDIS